MSTKRLLLPFFALLLGFQGCIGAIPLENLCAMPEWSEFDQEVKSAQISLRPWLEEHQLLALQVGSAGGRAPASLQEAWTESQGLHKIRIQSALSERDRTSWKDWSRKKLSLLQDLIDQVEYFPERRQARDEFSKMANSLVSFHGYSEQGKIAPMLETLRKIRESSIKGHELLCSP